MVQRDHGCILFLPALYLNQSLFQIPGADDDPYWQSQQIGVVKLDPRGLIAPVVVKALDALLP